MFEGDFYSRIWWCWRKNSSNYQRNIQTYWRNGCQSEDEEEKRNHNGGHLQLIPECERTVRTGSQNIKGSSTKRWRSVRSVSVVPGGSVKQVLLSICYICLCLTGWEGRYLSAVNCQSSKVWNLRGCTSQSAQREIMKAIYRANFLGSWLVDDVDGGDVDND